MLALGLGQARGDGVDGDPVLADLAGQRAREREDAALRGDVVRQVRRAGEHDVGGDVDDATVARLAHRLVAVVAREERAVEVHRHDPSPLGEVDVVPRGEGDDGGVVDEHVELPEGADGLVDHPLDVGLLGDVDLEPDAALRRRRLPRRRSRPRRRPTPPRRRACRRSPCRSPAPPPVTIATLPSSLPIVPSYIS